jgi:hypothetical protein
MPIKYAFLCGTIISGTMLACKMTADRLEPIEMEGTMAVNSRKRQLQKERKEKKRKEKKQQLARMQNAGIAERMRAAADYPVLHSWISESIDDQGMGHVLLSRELPGGRVAVAVFLVDRYCLGVKDVLGEVLGRAAYADKFERGMREKNSTRDAPPAEVCKLVRDAIVYAQALGIPPHPDAAKVLPIFGSIDPNECKTVFEFGKNGKPFFMPGPYDTPERCRQIMATLTSHCGQTGFDYAIPVPSQFLVGGDDMFEESEEFEHQIAD